MSTWKELISVQYLQICKQPSDIYKHLPRLNRLVNLLQPDSIIECGVRQGNSTVAFLEAAQKLPNTTLYSFDPAPVEGFLEQAVGQIPQWEFFQRVDLPYNLDLPDQVDIIFIDTDHSYELTRMEIVGYAPHLSEGGFMLFHDTDDSWGFGVKRAIEDWVRQNPEWHFHNWPENNGLGLLTRRNDYRSIVEILDA